jgi:hypothetical protein
MGSFVQEWRINIYLGALIVLTPDVPADLDPPQNGPPGPNPLSNMDRGVHIR